MILFSANVSEKHRVRLKNDFPNQKFVFCESKKEIMDQINDAEVFVTYGNDVTEELIEKAPNLKWVACLSAGIDQFPLQKLAEREILVTNARGIHKTQMAEYAIAMFLQVYRNSKTIIDNERKATWDKGVRVQEMAEKTMLILGTGAIGGETARLAKAFRMKTIGVSRSGRDTENFDEVYPTSKLKEILPKADLIVSVLPSTEETRGLLTYDYFKIMKDSAVFLNMGRGDVLIEGDLLKAIQEKAFRHAILDVFIEEPLPKDHPFWKEENITVTPHISGLSPAYVRRALEIFKTNLSVFEKGEGTYKNTVDLHRGY
jgi:phosphoglycerate dehydrogenase-like enzyme